jgi:hypothetical protein
MEANNALQILLEFDSTAKDARRSNDGFALF